MKKKSNKGYLSRSRFVALLMFAIFLAECIGLLYNSEIAAGSNSKVASYKEEIEEKLDKQNIVMGDIYDRNGTALLTFNDSIVNDTGTYIDDEIYSEIIGYCRNNDSIDLLNRYEKLLRTPYSDSNLKGYSLHLTLDHELQQVAYQALVDRIGESGRGSMVVMNADTGEILAMVCRPTFDANNISEEMKRFSEDEYLNYPLYRTGNTTAPGSTFKLVSSMVMLENGMEDFTTADDTTYEGSNYTIKNYSSYQTQGTIGLQDALAKSSNVFFVKALLGMDGIQDKLTEKAKKLYLGEKLSLDFANITSSWTFDDDTWSQLEQNAGFNAEYETAASLFGQAEVRMTTVQGAMLAAGIINGGKIMTPYMVASASDAKGKKVDLQSLIDRVNKAANTSAASKSGDSSEESDEAYSVIPATTGQSGQVLSEITDETTAAKLLEIMKYGAVNQYGFDETLGVAAKSGTAETGADANGGNNTWMVAACNIDGTNYAVCINWAKAASGVSGSDMKTPVETVLEYIADR